MEEEDEEEDAEESEEEAAEDLGASGWLWPSWAADRGPASEAAVCLGVGSGSGARGWLSQAAGGVREEFPWVAVAVVAGAALWLSWLENQGKDNGRSVG